MSAPAVYHAECLCQSVQYTLAGEPFHFVICHCKNCKQSSGSAFLTNAMFKPQQVSITKGESLITDYADSNTLSGNTIVRAFCSKCGSCLFIKPSRGDIVITHPSAIKETVTWVPKKEFHGDDKWHWIKEISFQAKKPAKL